jgi:hypothetical protein
VHELPGLHASPHDQATGRNQVKSKTMTTIKEVLDNLGGAALIAGCVIFRPLV